MPEPAFKLRLEGRIEESNNKGGKNMNSELQQFARNQLKIKLAKCTEKQQRFFKQMYAHGNLELSINDVIDKMDNDKLDWAMQQVQTTLNKKKEKKP